MGPHDAGVGHDDRAALRGQHAGQGAGGRTDKDPAAAAGMFEVFHEKRKDAAIRIGERQK